MFLVADLEDVDLKQEPDQLLGCGKVRRDEDGVVICGVERWQVGQFTLFIPVVRQPGPV